MECGARLNGVSKDFLTGEWLITFSTKDDITQMVESITDKALSLKAVLFRKKRSLDANAYYWLLIGKLSAKLNISAARLHNTFLCRHPHQETIDGRIVYIELPDTDEAEEKAWESMTYHLRPTPRVYVKAGAMVRDYELLRGSHTFDTEEMSALINDLVDECKRQGIETMTPEEMEKMMAMYEKEVQRRAKHHSEG